MLAWSSMILYSHACRAELLLCPCARVVQATRASRTTMTSDRQSLFFTEKLFFMLFLLPNPVTLLSKMVPPILVRVQSLGTSDGSTTVRLAANMNGVVGRLAAT